MHCETKRVIRERQCREERDDSRHSSFWFVCFGASIMALMAGCGATLEEIPSELDAQHYECMQHYEADGPVMVRKSGQSAPDSSFLTINRSKDAFEWRLAMVDSATESLDLQYFLWRTDDTGALLIRRVVDAANRGVKVRMLMDDLDSVAWNQRAAILSLHPNIEVRVFNPFQKKRGGWTGRSTEFLSDLDRLNHRMHNKLMLADNKVAIVGGRNIGNEYFGAGSPLDYRDYDLIAIGPIAKELKDSFETYWNSVWSDSVRDLPEGDVLAEEIDTLRAELDRQVSESALLDAEFEREPQDWSARIATAQSQLITAPARSVFDCPPPGGDQFPIQSAYTLRNVMKQAQEEILIISPYFVPLEQFRVFLGGVIDSGVNIRLLTNSLAATDHTYAFSGYYNHRQELLSRGVEIYELRPDAAMWSLHRTESSQAKFVALHAKVVVLDRRWVYVGSMNFDPRAAHWNTELGLLVESEALANQVVEHFSEDLSPASSWRVERRPISEQQSQSDSVGRYRLYWISNEGETSKEPSRGVFQRMGRWFYSLLPIEEQL